MTQITNLTKNWKCVVNDFFIIKYKSKLKTLKNHRNWAEKLLSPTNLIITSEVLLYFECNFTALKI